MWTPDGDWRRNLEHASEMVGMVGDDYTAGYGEHWRAGYLLLARLVSVPEHLPPNPAPSRFRSEGSRVRFDEVTARGVAMAAPYTQDELTALMREIESDRVERKRSAADRSGIRRNLCAFANNLPGHETPCVIFIGVEDDGRCDYRNPLVAEIMHHLGFAQRFGLGVPLAGEALQDNGNPQAVFDFEPTQVSVTLRPAG